MKKLLYFLMILATTNLTAMHSEKLPDTLPKQLTELSRDPHPKEEDVQALSEQANEIFENLMLWKRQYNLLDELFHLIIDSTTKKERKKINKAKRKCFSHYRNFSSKLKDLRIAEMDIISRDPIGAEIDAVQKLIRALNLPPTFSTVKKVRIVDATSYISGLFLDKEWKDHYLSTLNSDSPDIDIEETFSDFVEDRRKVTFSDPVLKSTILSHMIHGSENHVYRNLMISCIARNTARHPLSYRYPYYVDGQIIQNKSENFGIVRDNRSHVTCNNVIGLDTCSDERTHNKTLFQSAYSQIGYETDCFHYVDDQESIFFHEVGHAIDISPNRSFIMDICDYPTFYAASSFLDLDITDLESKATFFNFPVLFTKSNYEALNQTKICFTSPKEIWQLFGIYMLLDGSYKNILYINKMSDFALKTSLGKPIRMDHLGKAWKDLQQYLLELRDKGRVAVKYRLPLEAYAALMDVCGFNLCGYVLKLMHPYGLYSVLHNEYRLNHRTNRFNSREQPRQSH